MPLPTKPLLQHLVGDDEVAALFSDEADIRAILRFEAGLAEAEADTGLIGGEAADAIVAAIAEFEPDWADLASGLAADGVVVPALIRQLRKAVGTANEGAVHFGATSQDAIDTSLVLRLGELIPLFDGRLAEMEKALDGLKERFGRQALTAHTRMQVALPFTVADKIATWAEPVVRHRAALKDIRRRLLVIQLGGPVGTRSSFDGKGEEVARRLAARLDLGLAPAWHSQRDPIVEFGSLLGLISGSLGKLGTDVALMAQSEVAEIVLERGGGSSAMAHKSNPVNAEVLAALARFNASMVGTLHQTMVHENERSGAAWTLEWMVLPQIAMATGASLRLGLKLLGQIGFPAQ